MFPVCRCFVSVSHCPAPPSPRRNLCRSHSVSAAVCMGILCRNHVVYDAVATGIPCRNHVVAVTGGYLIIK